MVERAGDIVGWTMVVALLTWMTWEFTRGLFA